jgi:hypothetical protein
VKETARIVREWARIDPHCWFCGVEVILEHDRSEGRLPDNFATFDHLFQRCNPDTQVSTRFGMTGKLACKGCNDLRGRIGQRLTRYGVRRINKRKGTGVFAKTRVCSKCKRAGLRSLHPYEQDGCVSWPAIQAKSRQSILNLGVGRKQAIATDSYSGTVADNRE